MGKTKEKKKKQKQKVLLEQKRAESQKFSELLSPRRVREGREAC